MVDEDKLAKVLLAVRGSSRYASVAERTVRRIATTALTASGGEVGDAVKRTKRGLHEVFGAYLPSVPRYERTLEAIRAARDEQALRDALARAMSSHASTRERLPILSEFYAEVFAHLDRPPRVIADLACGMNPLAVRWMPIDDDVVYLASDIDTRLVAFLDSVLTAMGVAHETAVRDLVGDEDPAPADVTFLLKTVPCVESQRRGRGWELVDAVASPIVVVSFPTKSLGQRSKGMYQTYSAAFIAHAADRAWQTVELEFDNELVYVITKDQIV
ncbi:MAG: 16S rRNA methyltransferase [Kutzneria sp.]|nr:16S rRNA methyltransferase [Kutzneria sp.]MBV9845900.1 16S rRNA methyltransferase [Kutzneria sp.]